MDAGAYILYGVDTKKAREQKAQRRGGAGRIAKGVISAAVTVHGAATQPPHTGYEPLGGEVKVVTQGERTTRARGQRQETTYRGRRRGGSSGSR